MNFNSKKTSLLILGITSLACSRTMFSLFNDPEGPNLLIVVVMAMILYAVSFGVYVFGPSQKGLQKLLLAIFSQIVVASAFYFGLS
ncbi:MAG: hypothetical protein JWN89_387 [Parcubacteria group bacterium]|nr:hypothetical protein [Parcubacteria group bacterium]